MKAYDLIEMEEFHGAFFRDPPDSAVLQRLSEWLAQDKNRLISLYHGTSAQHPVLTKGLLPTSAIRAKSLASSHGYVCFSVFPAMAETFAKMAYPGREVVVYTATLSAGRLLPDLDQIRLKRLFGGLEIKESLAHSLAAARGCRVRGKVSPNCLRVYAGTPELAKEARAPSAGMS